MKQMLICSVLILFAGLAQAELFTAVGMSSRPAPQDIQEFSASGPQWQWSGAQKNAYRAFERSMKTNVVAMAGEAAEQMMEAFSAAGRTPKAVLFVERVAGVEKGYAREVGAAVKKAAGGVPVYGTGGASTYGVTWGEGVQLEDSTFRVIGLDGDGLEVTGVSERGKIEYMYGVNKKTREAAAAGDEEAKAKVKKEQELRDICFKRGQAVAEYIPELSDNGFILLMGALHNDWHVTYAEGMKDALPEGTVMIGGVGTWDDYIYNNGEAFTDSAGKQNVIGRLAIAVDGRGYTLSAFGSDCGDRKYSAEGVADHTQEVTDQLLAGLNGKQPDALFAFSCVTRMNHDGSKILHAGVLTEQLKEALGEEVDIFGNFCGGEVYLGRDGTFTAGGDRLVAVAIDNTEQ